MAQRLTTEEEALIRRLYAQCGVYADVARIVGRSPSTVAKCVKEGALSASQTEREDAATE